MMEWIREIGRFSLPKIIPTNSAVHLNKIDVSKGWLGKLEFDVETTPPRPKIIKLFPSDEHAAVSAYWLPNKK